MKRFIFNALRFLCVSALFRHLYRNRVLVLMYHGVIPDNDSHADGDWLQVRASEFLAQMTYLADHYEVCGFSRALTNSSSTRPLAIVTFDDGYANNCSTALPILAKLGLPATIFVTTAMVNTHRLFWWDRLRLAHMEKMALASEEFEHVKSLHPSKIEAHVDAILNAAGCSNAALPIESYRALDSSEIAKLLHSGLIELGSHTHQHEILLHLNDAEVKETLGKSAQCLHRWGSEAKWFAAPNGDFREDQVSIIKKAGFEICVGTRTGHWDAPNHRFSIPRIGIGRGLTLAEFMLATSGALDWVRFLRSRRTKVREQ